MLAGPLMPEVYVGIYVARSAREIYGLDLIEFARYKRLQIRSPEGRTLNTHAATNMVNSRLQEIFCGQLA